MKRLLLLILFVLLTVMPFSNVMAYNVEEPGPHVMADLMPDSTAIFAATRIGNDFIAELDAITVALYEKLPPSLAVDQPYTIDATARMALSEQGIDWDELSALMGNYAAVGMEPVGGLNSGEDPLVTVIAEITDQAGVEAFILANVPNPDEAPERQEVGDAIVYQENGAMLMITPSYLVFTNRSDYSPDSVASPLSASEDFNGALNNLPAERYNFFAYISSTVMVEAFSQGDAAALQMIGVQPTDIGSVVLGGTILAGNTFTIDAAVQTASPMPTSFVSKDFLNAMPGTTDAFIVASDFTNLYGVIVELVGTVSELNGEEDPTAQIPALFNFTGLDLEEEVLSWTTGSYGIFVGADVLSLVQEMMSAGIVTELTVDAGIIIEATDVALAQNAAAKLGETLNAFLANEEGVTISQSDVDGTAITSIALEVPMDPTTDPLQLELVLTATDQFFFFGTRSAFDAISSGNTLATNAAYGKSSQYFLDNATSAWFTNSDGLSLSTVISLASLGPAIGDVYENVLEGLGETSSSDSATMSPMGPDIELIMEAMGVYEQILNGMTISSSISESGVVNVRATMSVNP